MGEIKRPKHRGSNLTIAPELARITRHRARLNDPEVTRRKDPEAVIDDNRKLDDWEKKTRDALVVLSLRDNDGIAMLLEEMDTELSEIDENLRTNRPKNLSPDGAMEYAQTQYALISKRELWEWFRSFFTDAKRNLREVRQDLDLQDQEDEIAPGY